MKLAKISLGILSIVFISSSYAMPGDGTYFGLNTGYSWARSSSNTDLVTNSNKGFAYGVFIGQDITNNISLEIGGNKYANLKYNFPADSATSTVTYKFYDADLLLVNRLSITDGLAAYVKFGGSYVWEKPSANLAGTETISTQTTTFIRPEAVIGAQYKVTDNFAVNAYFSRVFGEHDLGDDNYLPNLDMAAISLAYYI